MRPPINLIAILAMVLAASPALAGYYDNTAQWMKGGEGFRIAWPVDFEQSQDGSWRITSNTPGKLLLRIEIPRAIESQTNFGGADLTVGASRDAKALAACLRPGNGEIPAGRVRANGADFLAFKSSDAGMSRYQDNVSYRTLHGGQCWAVEYTIRSTALGVYDPSLGLKAFNEVRVRTLLERIIRTFRFA